VEEEKCRTAQIYRLGEVGQVWPLLVIRGSDERCLPVVISRATKVGVDIRSYVEENQGTLGD